MMGLVFTELLEMVEAKWSADLVDDIIDTVDPPSGGAYTAVGVYEDAELVGMVVALSERTGVPVAGLLHAFGVHLFARFVASYPMLFQGEGDVFGFLEGIETRIHTEVRKLYPAAAPPVFECDRSAADTLVLVYRSERGLAAFAGGLLQGCGAHFGEELLVAQEDLGGGDGKHVRFTITRG